MDRVPDELSVFVGRKSRYVPDDLLRSSKVGGLEILVRHQIFALFHLNHHIPEGLPLPGFCHEKGEFHRIIGHGKDITILVISA